MVTAMVGPSICSISKELHHRVEVWIVAIWQRIASSTGVSSPTWPSSLKSARTVPATHCGEGSLSRQTHDGLVAHDTMPKRSVLASGLIINDDRDLKALRSL